MEPYQSSVSHSDKRHSLTVLFVILLAPMVATALAVFGVWLVIPWQTTSRQEALSNVVLSGIFAQSTLLATWNALGEGRHFVRPITSLVCLVLFWLVGISALQWLIQVPSGILIVGIAMFVQWMVIQIPLWILRIRFGWQLGFFGQHPEVRHRGNVQLGIKHLILWTTIVAIVLSIGKSIMQSETIRSHSVPEIGIFLVFNCLLAWPMTLSVLTDRWMPACVASAFFIAAAVTFAEPYIFEAALGSNSSRPHIFLWLNGIQFLWICGTMFIARRFGYRLVRAW